MTEMERGFDLTIAELEHENRLVRARNERLEHKLNIALGEIAQFKIALERIIAISQLALLDSGPQGTAQAWPKEHDDKASY